MSFTMSEYWRSTGALPKYTRRSNSKVRGGKSTKSYHPVLNERQLRVSERNSNYMDCWYQPSERDNVVIARSAKNSNAGYPFCTPTYSTTDTNNCPIHSTNRQQNCSNKEFPLPVKMTTPAPSRVQTPPIVQAKSTNVNKMPDRDQVESRLSQIRDYIKATSTMMESLSQSSDPRAQAQHEKLSKMVEDLYDSETKLSKLCEDYEKHWIQIENCENGVDDDNEEHSREAQLRKKMEESQKKLATLQEHQANLVDMQQQVREKLIEARQAQEALLLEEKEGQEIPSANGQKVSDSKADKIENETSLLAKKLSKLRSKKIQMNQIIAEIQGFDKHQEGLCSADNSRNVKHEIDELDVTKAQISRMNTFMELSMRLRESADDPDSDPELEGNANVEGNDDVDVTGGEQDTNMLYNSVHNSDADDTNRNKRSDSIDTPTVEQFQSLTKELKEQQALVMTARAELQRLRQASMPAASTKHHSSQSCSTPPVITAPSSSERKQSNNFSTNNNNVDARQTQNKQRQLEDYMKKDHSHASSVNHSEVVWPDWSSRRGSNSHHSHNSSPANLWPPPSADAPGSHDHSMGAASASANLLDIGAQPILDNGYGINWWESPPAPHINQPQQVGSAEYYRQLVLGSQAQQLQMMSTTIQQCCQLLWAQQRELQSMRVAMTQMQLQLQQTPKIEDHSNLDRHHFGNVAEAALPPSSSLPNLASLPNSSPASAAPLRPEHPPNVQQQQQQQQQQHQQQQQQLNNQVPPGNRANNYWDNFRSYSRQNLLSGSSKTVTDYAAGISSNAISTNSAAAPVINSTHVKDKCNREHGPDNLPTPNEAQYSLNLQLPSNLQQRLERKSSVTRNNILSNDNPPLQQTDNFWEDNAVAQLLPAYSDDEVPNMSVALKRVLNSLVTSHADKQSYLCTVLSKIAKISEHERLRYRLIRSLNSLASRMNESTGPTIAFSNSSGSSDDDLEHPQYTGANNNTSNMHFCLEDFVEATEQASARSSTSTRDAAVVKEVDITDFEMAAANISPYVSSSTPGYNEDLAEADQSRPQASSSAEEHPQQQAVHEENATGNDEAADQAEAACAQFYPTLDNFEAVLQDLTADDDNDKREYVILDSNQASNETRSPAHNKSLPRNAIYSIRSESERRFGPFYGLERK